MTRIAHVITGLGGGGAEFMLCRLVAALTDFEHAVVSLSSDGQMVAALNAAGVEPVQLNMGRGVSALLGLPRLRHALAQFNPDLVQTWMCHADLLGGVVARVSLNVPVAWGVHQVHEGAEARATTRAVQYICAKLSSKVPNRIVVCSDAARTSTIAAGYDAERCEVIYNGIPTDEYFRSREERIRVRTLLNLGEADIALLLPARWHADKDYPNFFAAAKRVLARLPTAKFLLAGAGTETSNIELQRMIEATGAHDAFVPLGFRQDMRSVFSAADVGVLSSRTEAMPNVLLEGMACELPFAATDVGDISRIVGDAGRIVPPANPGVLADAMVALALDAAGREAQGKAARQRICEAYSIEASAERYAGLYRQLTSGGRAPGEARVD